MVPRPFSWPEDRRQQPNTIEATTKVIAKCRRSIVFLSAVFMGLPASLICSCRRLSPSVEQQARATHKAQLVRPDVRWSKKTEIGVRILYPYGKLTGFFHYSFSSARAKWRTRLPPPGSSTSASFLVLLVIALAELPINGFDEHVRRPRTARRTV
jgi:hypothetical protein